MKPDLTPQEQGALEKVRDLLRSGKIVHHENRKSRSKKRFDMGTSYMEGGCGTTACIGGWMAHFMKIDDEALFVDEFMGRGKFNKLFWDNTEPDTTPAQAAQAIDNFLETGDPRWDEVLENS